MKKHDISHWVRNSYFNAFFLFVQTIEENTFNYSYESYRTPALNLHYLCLDTIKTCKGIKEKVILDGNIIPLSEELEHLISNDIYLSAIGKSRTLLLNFDKNGATYDITSSEINNNRKAFLFEEIAKHLLDLCSAKNSKYFEVLCDILIDNIFNKSFSLDSANTIYNVTRMMCSELINAGYSKEYIYSSVIKYFYDIDNPIDCSEVCINTFLERFNFKEYNYKVLYGVNMKAGKVMDSLGFETHKPTAYEKNKLNLQRLSDSVVVVKFKSIDNRSAYSFGRAIINNINSFYRINQHNSKLFFSTRALVYNVDLEECESLYPLPNPMKKLGNTSSAYALNSMFAFEHLPKSFMRAITLHGEALENKSSSNQLLNLWTIIEILIDTKRDNEDRINAICNVLISVLNRCYMYNNIKQLLDDIRACSSENIDEYLSKVSFSIDEEISSVEKLGIVLAVNEFHDEFEYIVNSVSDFPLLVYRLNKYNQEVFKDSESIYDYLDNHSKRLRWHIMRIYRNRNMIVHDGSAMPYRNCIVENLHYYVDVLFDTLIDYYVIGMYRHSSIYKEIINSQINYRIALGQSNSKNRKFNSVSITQENAIALLFNNYHGNALKQATSDISDYSFAEICD